MSNMHKFYDQLFSEKGAQSKYYEDLVELTKAERSQVEAFESEITWAIWHAPSE